MDAAPDQRDEATEGAQNVVDRVTSYHYSSDRAAVESELDEGMGEAGVEMEPDEHKRVVDDIEDLKQDETLGTPVVEHALPSSDQTP